MNVQAYGQNKEDYIPVKGDQVKNP